MTVRCSMIAVLLLASTSALAAKPTATKGGGAARGPTYSPGAGGYSWRHAPPAPPNQKPEPKEQWDTPVEQVPDWDQAEAAKLARPR